MKIGDKPIIDSRIMLQLQNNNVRIELPYKFEQEIRIENCLFAYECDIGINIGPFVVGKCEKTVSQSVYYIRQKKIKILKPEKKINAALSIKK